VSGDTLNSIQYGTLPHVCTFSRTCVLPFWWSVVWIFIIFRESISGVLDFFRGNFAPRESLGTYRSTYNLWTQESKLELPKCLPLSTKTSIHHSVLSNIFVFAVTSCKVRWADQVAPPFRRLEVHSVFSLTDSEFHRKDCISWGYWVNCIYKMIQKQAVVL